MKRIGAAVIAAVAALYLGGCDGSSSSGQLTGSSGGRAEPSGWTTLGTRAETSASSRAPVSSGGAEWTDYDPPAGFPKTAKIENAFITMKDGTRLAASVTLPADADGNAVDGRFPAILLQTGYNKEFSTLSPALGGVNDYITRHGYAQVLVDTRGTGRSEGEWESFGVREQSDYPQVVDWVTEQSWSDGRIGVMGASLLGITALLTAEQQQPAIKAAFTIVPMADAYRDIAFSGGQVNVGFIPFWLGLVTTFGILDPTLTTNPSEAFRAEIDHIVGAAMGFQVPQVLKSALGDPDTVCDGDVWDVRSPIEKAKDIRVPTFVVGGAHDIFQRGAPLLYEALKDHVPAKLLIGPWNHEQGSRGQGLPADGVPIFDHIELRWFDQYLKGMDVGADRLPTVTQFVYGANRYVTAEDWPHPDATAERLYLHGNRSLSATTPAPDEAANVVLQQPANGICSPSTAQWTAGILGVFGVDPPCFEDDSLVELLEASYDTAPLASDLYLNGPIQADLWLSTTSLDFPVVVRIDDVGMDGTALPLTNGILQGSRRAVDPSRSRFLDGAMIEPWHPFTRSTIEPVGIGDAVPVSVEIFPTSALVEKGHRLRVAVGASDFPHGVPPLPVFANELVGLLTIESDARHPSSVVLPVVPSDALER